MCVDLVFFMSVYLFLISKQEMGFERFATFIRATVVSLNHFHAMSPSENEKLAAEREGRKNKKKKRRNRLTKREYKRKRRIDGNKRNRLKSGRGFLG